MNSNIVIGIILIVIGIIYFSRKNGLKEGLVYSVYIVLLGGITGLISIYFSDYAKWILSCILIVIAFILNYPPSKKFVFDNIKNIFNKK